MFSQKVNVQAPNGEMVEIEIHHDAELSTRASFFIVACGWLDHFKDHPQYNTKFDGHYTDQIVVRKANFPWARQLRRGYWIFSGFNTLEHGTPIIIIHDRMILQAQLGVLLHELMHVFYDRRSVDPNTERFIQEKAIENVRKILENYRYIAHPNNEPNFHRLGTTRSAVSFHQIEQARDYLRFGFDLHFYRHY